ncbi:MAG TPA: WXG100 family type VII secretion target [Phytomonospora sp.]
MTDNTLVYNHGVMADGASAIGTAIGKLNQQLADVEAGFKPIEETWQGEALTAYLQRRQQWRDAANSIRDILGRVQTALTQSSEAMSGTDKRAATYFQR